MTELSFVFFPLDSMMPTNDVFKCEAEDFEQLLVMLRSSTLSKREICQSPIVKYMIDNQKINEAKVMLDVLSQVPSNLDYKIFAAETIGFRSFISNGVECCSLIYDVPNRHLN